MKIEDLNILGRVSQVYELRTDRVYLILVDGNHFKHASCANLFRDLEAHGIDYSVHIVASLYPKSIQVHEASKE